MESLGTNFPICGMEHALHMGMHGAEYPTEPFISPEEAQRSRDCRASHVKSGTKKKKALVR